MNRFSALALVALVACNGGNSDILTLPPTTTGTDAPKEENKPVAGLDIVGITVSQGVEITLYDEGSGVPDIQAPIIRQRDLNLRVFVNTHDEFESHKVRAVLEVEDNNGVEVIEVAQRVSGRSLRGQLDSTFNFDVPADLVKANTEFRVALYEVNVTEAWPGTVGSTTWESGSIDTVKSDVLNIRLIPVRYNADGSGRLPDTSDAQIANYRDLIRSMYPVEDVTVEVGNVLDWPYEIRADGSGWSDLLYTIADMRDNANVYDNTYFYGIFEPDSNFFEFCNFGCVLGLSNLAWNANDPWYRSSIGLGYSGFQNQAAETFVHEVGHAHGRNHANCGGASGIDPNYPYSPNAIIGSWGYDTYTGELFAPDETHDVMAYCTPLWISDYQYFSLYQRISDIQAAARQATIPWQTIRVDMQGEARLDKIRDFTPNVAGEPVTVQLLGWDGGVIDEVVGRYSPLSHIHGGMVMIDPITDPAVVDVRVPALIKTQH